MGYTFPDFTTSIVDTGFSPEDASTRELYKEVAAFAKHGQPIVIFGPSGAGKEFLARHYYNTLIKTEFYQQYKESWPLKFNELKQQYSAHYSGQSLDIFLNSIKAGVFLSINAATIYPNLAESILFGHEANSFNEALTSPGLLESIKYGVLFMDEVGELPKNIQAKLLRAVDSEIVEGRRLSGKMNYSLKDIIIISATNQPRNKMRDDFYNKIGIEVNIKGIDERPKDVRKSIPYFISKAIGKRKDYAAVINMFGIRGIKDVTKLSETDEVRNFAKTQSKIITDEILKRSWDGNFRALRKTLESSVFRIESTENPETFSMEFQNYLHHYISVNSENAAKTFYVIEKPYQANVFPSLYPEIDFRILEEINNGNIFPNTGNLEKNVLSVFLSTTQTKGFKRSELQEFYKKHDGIKHVSEAHIRNRINKLLNENILTRWGNGKSVRYQLTQHFMDLINIKNKDLFSLPKINRKWKERNYEIDTLKEILNTTERIYIQAPPRFGKSAFITMFGNTMEKQYNFYYYPLGEAGIKKLYKDILKRIQSEEVNLAKNQFTENPVIEIHPLLGKIFKAKAGKKPILILDNAHYISDTEGLKTIVDIATKWKEVILILLGDTMDNALAPDYYEFSLGSWGKEA